MEKITEYLIQSTVNTSEVKAWEEIIKLPTYEIGEEEKNPLFLEQRVYQGSSGSVYPYPVVEKISHEKTEKKYKAIFIENEYIKVMILPELGGRIHMAYDKVKQRHFVYYNQVVKPALVGLTGPWISGGIEFNWPQHHRPSTFLPTDSKIETFEDGSVTVWCSEVEKMFRTKGMAGFTLYPGKSYIEIKAKVYNRTPYPQTFLWWANPAVVVNDDYYSVFPPDVDAVFDHGKRAVSNFPIATGTYYEYDYSAGVDISRYKNIPVPTSYMAVNSKYDFVGGYEEHLKAGLLHVADHHISTGKKQWTWGCGDFGKAWDKQLTDEDGPYIELMTGCYCDNQPDFTWLQPYEQKSWTQYFMPYQEVGLVKNANKNAMVNVERVGNDELKVSLYTTAIQDNVHIILTHNDDVLLDDHTSSSPSNPYSKVIKVDEIDVLKLKLNVLDNRGVVLVKYEAEPPVERETPSPAKAAKQPSEIESIEQLFLAGHHIEQYRHATYLATDYYEEALRREPSDIRCNNAMGLLMLRRGEFAIAQEYLERALETQTDRNANPYDGEPAYNLGCAKRMRGDIDGAYTNFFKSTWNGAWQDAGYFALAQIDMMRGDYEVALDHIDRSLHRNWLNHKGRQLKASALRKLDRTTEAQQLIDESLKMDRFNIGCMYEQWLITSDEAVKSQIKTMMRSWANSYLEYAIDYINAGMYSETIGLLSFITEENATLHPMIYYALGYSYSKMGDTEAALKAYQQAEAQSPNYCFPNKLDEVLFLEDAKAVNPSGAKAPYYLGNFYYAARRYERAVAEWELSLSLDATYPTVLRNLSLAYYNKQKDTTKALTALEQAFALDTTDARLFMELDQLRKKAGLKAEQRLQYLLDNIALVEQRDDLCVELARLYNQTGEYQKCYDLLKQRRFQVWEGGEGVVTSQYVNCRIELAKAAMASGEAARAVELLLEAEVYPDNLGEGKLVTMHENDLHYYLGCAYEMEGDEAKAREYFTIAATSGSNKPKIALYYHDRHPEKIFYQGLAWAKLGDEAKSKECFENMVSHGAEYLGKEVAMDYFAVSMPELQVWEGDLNERYQIHSLLVLALGHLGLGNGSTAREYYAQLFELDCNNLPAILSYKLI